MSEQKYALTQNELDAFLQIGKVLEFDAGGVLFYEGETSEAFFIVVEGLVKGGRFDGGKERIYHFFFPNTMVGEVSYLEGANYPLTAVFATKGRAVAVTREALKSSKLDPKTLNNAFLKSIVGKVRHLQNGINQIASKNCKLKIATFALEHAEWLEWIQIKEAAAVLNITRESASRAVSFFIKNGMLEKTGFKIRIKDKKALSDFANGEKRDNNHAVLPL